MVKFRNLSWDDIIDQRLQPTLFIAASGYEHRCTYQLRALTQSIGWQDALKFSFYGFERFSDLPSRKKNDEFFHRFSETDVIPDDDAEVFANKAYNSIVEFAALHDAGDIHIDYSSMPRSWYCRLAVKLLERRVLPNVQFWYVASQYSERIVNTAGIEDFHHFSGDPDITGTSRSHLFGLGYDVERSHAIWTVLDPQRYGCFYANPGATEWDSEHVLKVNKEILAHSQISLGVPIDNFPIACARIQQVVLELSLLGNVVLVPDGPKPLILASSLLPVLFPLPGLTCLHVAGRSKPNSDSLDRNVHYGPFGFSLPGYRALEQRTDRR